MQLFNCLNEIVCNRQDKPIEIKKEMLSHRSSVKESSVVTKSMAEQSKRSQSQMEELREGGVALQD